MIAIVIGAFVVLSLLTALRLWIYVRQWENERTLWRERHDNIPWDVGGQ